MADPTYTVKQGDTLSKIAQQHNCTVAFLAKINNIPDPDKIYVGQVIKIANSASTSSSDNSSSSTTTTTSTNSSNNSNKPTITQFGIQSNTDRTVFATWSWNRANTKEYIAHWAYGTGEGISFVGSETTIANQGSYYCQSVYTAPANATSVSFWVKPVAQTYKSNDKDVLYWTAEWSTEKKYWFASNPPTTPPVPTVTIKDYKLTAKLENLNVNATQIEFQIVQDDSTVFATGIADITTSAASHTCSIFSGHTYKVRCRSKKDKLYSNWSEYSASQGTIAATPGITSYHGASATSIYLAWIASGEIDTFDIRYANTAEELEASNASTTVSNIETRYYTLTGLESGKKYFLQVRAVNAQGTSGWSPSVSVTIGSAPAAPTTWSSTTTAIVGETIILYWVHNTEDGSKERYAELELYIDDLKFTYQIVRNESDLEDEEINSSYKIDTSSNIRYADGAKLRWRVRTAGISLEYGDWSIERTISIYAPATLSTTITDSSGEILRSITSFPFYIKAVAGPPNQKPISYYVSIVSDSSYETVDEIGNVKMVVKGDEVYSRFYDISTDLTLEITAGSIDLQNNVTYLVNVMVVMDTGLSAETFNGFDVQWKDEVYIPNAQIAIDPETLAAHIRPYCEYYGDIFYEVSHNPYTGTYTITDKVIYEIEGTTVHNALTTEGELVYVSASGVYFTVLPAKEGQLVKGITLSVYRREFDGSFIEIGSGLVNEENTFVTDPHPSLDYARYRVVAISDTTGAVSYADIPGVMVGEKAVIIQWDETWKEFDAVSEDAYEQPVWAGSMLKLPYNIDISDSNSSDVTLVKYIGRSRPVSYYGTQIESKATWNVEIDKKDKNTLYALRRLAVWMGDVYVREPSGSGYWANISVSFSQTHCELTIPVTLDITRVEGGI